MEKNIILSICIPTFNRAEYLENTLQSIVSQKKFIETDEVEIVISDNCSEDNTEEIAQKFIAIYGDKVRYYRNSENITDANFEKVLSYGKGLFLKLNNDTLMHQSGTLEQILDTINQHKIEKEILFFSNGAIPDIPNCKCDNLSSFVSHASFYSTWIVCFGFWREDFEAMEGFSRNRKLQLVQTDVLFRLICSNRSVYIDNTKIFSVVETASKGGYSIYQVFVTNYLGILESYKNSKQLTARVLFSEKTKLLKYFLIPWTLNLWQKKQQFTFDRKGAFSIVFKKYCLHPAFYLGLGFLFLSFAKFHIQKLIKK